ncbi:MAG: protein-export chaperone SecB [Rhodospirillales bacterium]|nr:MAG: protein-export chaperone SecB [Rhodospirillales bacterium]
MTDETAAGAAADAPRFHIVHQYIKDLSFEVPGAPQSFEGTAAPDVAVNVDVSVNPLGEPRYEVVLRMDARATASGTPLFIIELVYAGLLEVSGLPQDQLQPALLIEGPRLLFPFARNIVAGLTRDGGLPPLMISPIDFVALYRNRVAKQQEQTGGAGEDGNGAS